MNKTIIVLSVFCLFLIGCTKEKDVDSRSNISYSENNGWTVPLDQLVLSSNPPDRIVSIDHPIFVPTSNSELSHDERVFILRVGDSVRIYPKNMIETHEIINDQLGDEYFAITYCPLTGSAIAWNRKMETHIAEFGVSGHLFQDNLIPYDRHSDNFYSQMRLESIKGEESGSRLAPITIIETSAGVSIGSFPNAKILTDTSDHLCDSLCYGKSPSGSKQINDNEYFGVIKQSRVHPDEALLFGGYLFQDSISLFTTYYDHHHLIIIGGNKPYFRAAFINSHPDKSIVFSAVQASLPIVFADSKGNFYDMTAYILAGPSRGSRLSSPLSYSAYQFAWDLFYTNHYNIFIE